MRAAAGDRPACRSIIPAPTDAGTRTWRENDALAQCCTRRGNSAGCRRTLAAWPTSTSFTHRRFRRASPGSPTPWNRIAIVGRPSSVGLSRDYGIMSVCTRCCWPRPHCRGRRPATAQRGSAGTIASNPARWLCRWSSTGIRVAVATSPTSGRAAGCRSEHERR